MRGAVDYLKGQVRLRAECRYPERFINICAREGVEFRDLLRDGDAAELTVSIAGYRRLRELAGETGIFSVKPVSRRGAPFFLWRIRKRYVLLLGMLLCLGAVWLSSFFIWQIDVGGNETVPDWEILSCLERLGVGIGSSTFSISQERISNEMLLMIPELSWITLNTSGSRLEVLVREETPEPDVIDSGVQAEVYAKKAGIITQMNVTQGEPAASPGDTVAEGDLLIAGEITGFRGQIPVHAGGQVWARTWYELSLEIPLETVEKRYTGKTTTRRAMIIGGKRVNLYFSGGNPYACYDKMTEYSDVTVGGAVMPLTFVRETYEEYEPVLVALDSEAAERILSARLLWTLEELIGDGSVTSTQYETTEGNGVLQVTLTAECLENIAAVRVLEDDIPESGQESG